MISAICKSYNTFFKLGCNFCQRSSGVNVSNVTFMSTGYFAMKKKERMRKNLLGIGKKKRDSGLIFVVLKKAVEGLGKKHQVVQVKRGYATNFLIPTRSALYATRENLFKCGISMTPRRAAIAALDLTKNKKSPTDKLLKYLAQKPLEIEVSRDADWTINKYVVAQEYQRKLQLHVPLQSLVMPQPFQTFGLHEVKIKVNDKVGLVPVKVNIVKHVPKTKQTEETTAS
ncbi:50S ribosomal protein L9 [Trichoplax sp. H2]|nr:50S ribosomal protein L9 [Trichoplax sp. H2]|eukprot:RDD46589.1 50S ribosomal protein L9 [Trichoplax sp. H2]